MESLRYGSLLGNTSKEVFYVSIENTEPIENNLYNIFFDGIQKDKFSLLKNNSLLDSYDEIVPYLFKITVSKEQYEEIILFFKHAVYKSRWFKLVVINDKTEQPVSIVIDDNNEESEPKERFISYIKQIHSGSSVSKTLNQYFNWDSFKFGTIEEIQESLQTPEFLTDNIHKLNVYNVGQGSLSAITNKDNVPLLYYDLGGGFAWNKHTYLNTINLCFSHTKTIIISHWDNDHLETAKRHFRANPVSLDNLTWIVPEQTITPSYFKLAAKMNRTGNLIIWPKTLRTHLSFWFGDLIKCNGPDKNHSCLALVVKSPKNDIKNILSPGDAAYKYIPYIKNIEFDGLVITHHGANFDDDNAPVPICENGNIAYSYGYDNTYFHPRDPSIDAHHAHGWKNRKNTIDGNISFTKSTSIMNVPCGLNCNLEIIQTF